MKNVTIEIATHAATDAEVGAAFKKFMDTYALQGSNLRMELISNLNGSRLALVYDWGDPG